MFTTAFWRATLERAVRAFAGTLISVWGVAGGILDVRGVDWGNALGVAGGAALVSVLLSLVATQVGNSASPSFVADPAAADKPPATGPNRLADRADLDQGLSGSNVRMVPGKTSTTGGYRGGDVTPPD